MTKKEKDSFRRAISCAMIDVTYVVKSYNQAIDLQEKIDCRRRQDKKLDNVATLIRFGVNIGFLPPIEKIMEISYDLYPDHAQEAQKLYIDMLDRIKTAYEQE